MRYNEEYRFSFRRGPAPAETKDIVMLMITAGADVYAVNNAGESVSDTAHLFGHSQLWAECLEACGYDVDEVHHGTNIDVGLSSAVDPQYTSHSSERTSKLSFADYLKFRKVFSPATEIIDLEDAENERVQELLRRRADWDSYARESREEEQEQEDVWKDWDGESVTGSDDYIEKSSQEENDNEETRKWKSS